jgi:hypothetical protein
MATVSAFVKDPSAVLDYAWNWATWLGTDTIATHTVTAEAGLTVASSTATTTAVTAWLSGGTVGESYTVTCRIVTAAARTDERSIMIQVRDR